MADIEADKTKSSKIKLNLSFDPKIVILFLLGIIVAMLFLWKPWSTTSATDQTIQVTGEATITDEPDEFVFYPSYEFKNPDKDAALAELTKKSEEVVAKLKELGVASSKIKTSSSGFDYPVFYGEDNKTATYSLQLTVNADSLEQAQKVEDYLITTAPSGAVSPQADFSETKRKVLEEKARDEATKDARAKADQMAKNLGFKVGKVKSVTDGTGFGIMPYEGRGMATDSVMEAQPTSLTVQPGENDLTYTVTVEYFLR